jgi:hypothetical protein
MSTCYNKSDTEFMKLQCLQTKEKMHFAAKVAEPEYSSDDSPRFFNSQSVVDHVITISQNFINSLPKSNNLLITFY